jgi:hypothetical protein
MNGHRINVAGDSPGETEVTVPLPITGGVELA